MAITVEEKAKRYDEALKAARDVYTYYCDDREQLRKIESIFPELKESEDEKTRKELLSVVNDLLILPDEQKSRFVAWLEKSVWSEEDEYYYGIIQYILNDEPVGATDRKNAINWFKSFKPQKQK